MEIYNEQIRDLLNPSSGYLELREDSKGKNIQVNGLTELSTRSTGEVSLKLLVSGFFNATGGNDVNQHLRPSPLGPMVNLQIPPSLA